MNWLRVSICTTAEGIEPVCGRLMALNIGGFEIEDKDDFNSFLENNHQYWDYVDDELMAEKQSETKVIIYVCDNEHAPAMLAAVKSELNALKSLDAEKAFGRLEIETESLCEEDWENNWKPGDYGNILYNDSKFVSLLYEIHGDTFYDGTKVRDAGEVTKTNIYDFIQQSESTVIIVDCENSDVYKLYSVLKNLNRDELDKVKKIILYDDIHTTRAWTLLEKVINIPVEYNQVQRLNNLKSLVDIKMTAGTCKEFYSNGVKSFILASSDSDFWGLISSLPDAEFLVLMEYEKCGHDIKNALEERDIYYCAMDDFCSGNISNLKELALIMELEARLKDGISLNANALLSDIYRECRIVAGDTEKQSFYNRYLKTLMLQLDENGDYHITIKRK